MRQKVHWVCQSPSPYNDYLFSALAADPSIDLLVHYVEGSAPGHPWRWTQPRRYPYRVFETRFGIDRTLLAIAFKESQSYFVLGGWNNPTLLILAVILGVRRQRFAIWTDAPHIFKRRPRVKELLRVVWLRWLFGAANVVMGTGTMALDHLRYMGCPNEKLVNLPYIVDTRPFDGLPGAAHRDRSQTPFPVFLSSGRLVNSHKGYDLAMRALALARSTGSLGRFRYRIAGVGPDEGILRALAAELGIQEEVKFVGWLQPEELPAFYASGDYFLHPAHFEPYGVAVIEAMAAGLVVIGSDRTGAIVDRICPIQAGFVHRAGDVADLSRVIRIATEAADRNAPVVYRARKEAGEWSVERAVAVVRELSLM